MAKKKYDFAGWATRNDVKCADGRTIRRNAFKENDGKTVPLIWNHDHDEPEAVLGHALLENRDEGIYAYCSFNDTERGQNAKKIVEHGDVRSLSIYANKLLQKGNDVLHGMIREVSLVLAGANPEATIDTFAILHGDEMEEQGNFSLGEEFYLAHSFEDGVVIDSDDEISHSDDEEPEAKKDESTEEKKNMEKEKQDSDKTIQDVVDTMNEEQKNALYFLVGKASEDAKAAKGPKEEDDDEEEENVKHNVFDNEENSENVLSHADMEEIVRDAKRCGSMKEAFLAHGIDDIEYLFPDNKNLTNTPGFINTNPSGWVTKVMNGVHHTPFARVKMMFADITMDTARAKGYIKGNKKKEETFALLKRVINPTTVYKKQKIDRDDIVDITDFDVVAWLKGEMRTKLNEELARAFLFGDGRLASDEDKISATAIIPAILDTDQNLYAMKYEVSPASGESVSHAIITSVVKGLDDYEGSGNVTLFIKSSLVSDMLLMEDTQGHRLYKSITDLANAMGVNEIVKVPASIVPTGFYGVALDLNDYNVGADKGGAVNMFDDFDIDYNAQKYLIETRCSGGLTVPHSAIVLAEKGATSSAEGDE